MIGMRYLCILKTSNESLCLSPQFQNLSQSNHVNTRGAFPQGIVPYVNSPYQRIQHDVGDLAVTGPKGWRLDINRCAICQNLVLLAVNIITAPFFLTTCPKHCNPLL